MGSHGVTRLMNLPLLDILSLRKGKVEKTPQALPMANLVPVLTGISKNLTSQEALQGRVPKLLPQIVRCNRRQTPPN